MTGPDLIKVRRDVAFRAGISMLTLTSDRTQVLAAGIEQATTVTALQLYHAVGAAMVADGAPRGRRPAYDRAVRAALAQLGIEVKA